MRPRRALVGRSNAGSAGRSGTESVAPPPSPTDRWPEPDSVTVRAEIFAGVRLSIVAGIPAGVLEARIGVRAAWLPVALTGLVGLVADVRSLT